MATRIAVVGPMPEIGGLNLHKGLTGADYATIVDQLMPGDELQVFEKHPNGMYRVIVHKIANGKYAKEREGKEAYASEIGMVFRSEPVVPPTPPVDAPSRFSFKVVLVLMALAGVIAAILAKCGGGG